eukprot:6202019-Pleurochrysis_carterae.AAC.2
MLTSSLSGSSYHENFSGHSSSSTITLYCAGAKLALQSTVVRPARFSSQFIIHEAKTVASSRLNELQSAIVHASQALHSNENLKVILVPSLKSTAFKLFLLCFAPKILNGRVSAL